MTDAQKQFKDYLDYSQDQCQWFALQFTLLYLSTVTVYFSNNYTDYLAYQDKGWYYTNGTPAMLFLLQIVSFVVFGRLFKEVDKTNESVTEPLNLVDNLIDNITDEADSEATVKPSINRKDVATQE